MLAELLVDQPVRERAAGDLPGTIAIGLAGLLDQTDEVHRKIL